VARFSEHSNETSGPIKSGECIPAGRLSASREGFCCKKWVSQSVSQSVSYLVKNTLLSKDFFIQWS
jgi:hypothetical protein